jgi:hypothetical protein
MVADALGQDTARDLAPRVWYARSVKRASSFAAGVLAGLAASGVAHADASDVCREAFSSSSELTRTGNLTRARSALITCASDACPVAMRPLCATDLRAIEPRIPSVVFAATMGSADLVDVRVAMDQVPLVASVDGRAVDVDPGRHVFRFEREGEAIEQFVVIREGEKNRAVTVKFTPRAAPAPPQPAPPALERPVPTGVWLFGGAAVVAAGFWIGFGASGLAQKGSLDECKGACTHDAIQRARTTFLLADVAAVATLAFATLGGVLFFARDRAPRGATVGVQPLPRGAAIVAAGDL